MRIYKTNNDLFVVRQTGAKRGGYFVEAGGHNGTRGSNTLLLEIFYGWTGLMVEPDAALFAQMKKSRPKVACENVCLYDRPVKVAFMDGVDGCGGILPHLSPSKNSRWGVGKPLVMQAEPLADLLKKHSAPTYIDYLSLDTEGSEFFVLRDFSFDQYKFGVITVEGDSCNSLLKSKGYQRVINDLNKEAPWEQYFLGA
jgi:hypothetical protein